MYISINSMWSGSEELWLRSAKSFEKEGIVVSFATKYNHCQLQQVGGESLNFATRYLSTRQRLLRKILPKKFVSGDLLEKFIQKNNPELVIISQGNNLDSLQLFNFCINNKIPYFTLTQLVTEVHFLGVNQENLPQYRNAYLKAAMNFFVSRKNMLLNNMMFGIDFKNSLVINNPCRVFDNPIIPFPTTNENFEIALVGRIECFHKGYDLLLNLLTIPKWAERNIKFNVYGDGPHCDLIRANIGRLNLKNVSLHGFTNDIEKIWRQNHLLFMPSRMEGQALVLIEAMYYGRASVVTNVGGAEELVKTGVNGYVAEACTVESLDRALEMAWQHRKNWEAMGLLSRRMILEKYEYSAEYQLNQKIKNTYQELRP